MNLFQKNNKKIEQLRSTFFLLGLTIAGGLTFLAFEWTTTTHTAVLAGVILEEIEGDFEYVEPFEIIKEVKEVKMLEQPKVKSNDFEIVPNDEPTIEKEAPIKKKVSNEEFKEGEFDDNEPEPIVEKEFTIVEHMPEFVGGVKELFKYLGENTKYPRRALKADIEGTVYIQFVIGKNGAIRNIKIIRGVNELLDNEALRVVKSMPDWKPGSQHGKKVSVRYQLPIHFKINH